MAGWRMAVVTGVIALLAGCGGGAGGPVVLPGGDLTPGTGTAQKGPFLAGTTVTLNTLTERTTVYNSTTRRPFLAPTGRSFTLETDALGQFDTSGIVLRGGTAAGHERFLEAHAEGYFFDEISGQRSSELIALRAVVDASRQKLHINVLTDLSRARTLALARAQLVGCTTTDTSTESNVGAACIVTDAELAAARAQAEREVLAAFNIPSDRLGSYASFGDLNIRNIAKATGLLDKVAPADQALLALSALVVQIGRDGAGITAFINAFESDLADGRLDDAALRAEISRASATVDFGAVARHMNDFYGTKAYVAVDLQQWVDATGGINGVIGGGTEYLEVPAGAATTAVTSASRQFTSTAANGSCVQLVSGDGTGVFVNPLVGSAAATVVTGQSGMLYVPKDASLSFQVRLPSAKLNSWARVSAWDASSAGVAGCATAGRPGLVGVAYVAAMPQDLVQFVGNQVADFARCFTLTATTRIRASDLRNPDVPEATELHEACRPLAAPGYLNNGYRFGQDHYPLLADPSMTKTARVVRVDVEDYRIGSDGRPLAEIRFVATDRYGRESAWRSTAIRTGGAGSPAGGWAHLGNQDPVDITLFVGARRYTSIPLKTMTSTGAVVDRRLADVKVMYRTAFLPTINNEGPGAVRADGARLTAVLVQGPGLGQGVVYVAPLQRGQTAFDFSTHFQSVEASLPDGRPPERLPRCGFTPTPASDGTWPKVPASCPLNWVGATTWAAPTVATSAGLSTLTYPTPVAATQPTGGVFLPADTTALFTQGTAYRFSLFYGNERTPSLQVSRRLRTSLPTWPAVHAMSWVQLDKVGGSSLQSLIGSASATTLNPFEALRPVAGLTTLDVSWTGQMMNRTEIFAANTNLQAAHYPRATPGDTVARGLNYVTLAPQLDQDGIPLEMQWSASTLSNGTPVTSPAGPGLGLSQVISLQHKTWDGSWKSQDFLIETSVRN